MKTSALAGVEWVVTVLALAFRAAASDPSEQVMLARARRGDARAFEQLLRRHDRNLRALAYRMLGSQTAMDDVLQEAYLRAFRGLDEFAGGAAFGTWLYRIVANACLDELRRAARRPQVPLDEMAEDPAPASRLADDAARRLDLAAALQALEPELRLVVLMVDAEGFSYDEVAGFLGIPSGTVASRLNRARRALRPHLRSEQGGRGP